jgi:hypothetical protein
MLEVVSRLRFDAAQQAVAPGAWLSVDSIADHRGGDGWTLRLTAVAFSWNPRPLDRR